MRIATSKLGSIASTAPLILSSSFTLPLQSGKVSAASTSSIKSFSTMSSQNELSTQNEQLIKDSQDLFGAKPSTEIFRRSWSPNAVFQDPICYAVGSRQFLAQWYGMPKAFSKSETLAWRVESSDDKQIIYHQKQFYKVKGLGIEKEMNSKVVIGLDGNGRITSFEDRWNGDELPSGYFAMLFRKANAVIMPYLVSVPKETSEAMAAASSSSPTDSTTKTPTKKKPDEL